MPARSNTKSAEMWYRKATDALAEATRPDAATNHRQRALENMTAYAQLAYVCALLASLGVEVD